MYERAVADADLADLDRLAVPRLRIRRLRLDQLARFHPFARLLDVQRRLVQTDVIEHDVTAEKSAKL